MLPRGDAPLRSPDALKHGSNQPVARESPRKLKAKTATLMARPGKITIHGASTCRGRNCRCRRDARRKVATKSPTSMATGLAGEMKRAKIPLTSLSRMATRGGAQNHSRRGDPATEGASRITRQSRIMCSPDLGAGVGVDFHAEGDLDDLWRFPHHGVPPRDGLSHHPHNANPRRGACQTSLRPVQGDDSMWIPAAPCSCPLSHRAK